MEPPPPIGEFFFFLIVEIYYKYITRKSLIWISYFCDWIYCWGLGCNVILICNFFSLLGLVVSALIWMFGCGIGVQKKLGFLFLVDCESIDFSHWFQRLLPRDLPLHLIDFSPDHRDLLHALPHQKPSEHLLDLQHRRVGLRHAPTRRIGPGSTLL